MASLVVITYNTVMPSRLVAVTFDNMGCAADIGRGTATTADPDEPGLRVGYPRVLTMLEEHGLPATFFVEGWNAIHHPERVAELVEHGHEVGLHGWLHESWASLDPLAERAILAAGRSALEAIGVPIGGFRAPGGDRGPETLTTLADLGFAYDASLGEDAGIDSASGLAVVPFSWPAVDWWWYTQRRPVADAATWLRGFKEVLATAGSPVVLVMHARVSAVDDGRAEALSTLLHGIAANPDLEPVTMGALADRLLAQGRGPVG